ncbi:MAG: hypothetical protein AB7U47_15390, partial [Variibacter sp.]
ENAARPTRFPAIQPPETEAACDYITYYLTAMQFESCAFKAVKCGQAHTQRAEQACSHARRHVEAENAASCCKWQLLPPRRPR